MTRIFQPHKTSLPNHGNVPHDMTWHDHFMFPGWTPRKSLWWRRDRAGGVWIRAAEEKGSWSMWRGTWMTRTRSIRRRLQLVSPSPRESSRLWRLMEMESLLNSRTPLTRLVELIDWLLICWFIYLLLYSWVINWYTASLITYLILNSISFQKHGQRLHFIFVLNFNRQDVALSGWILSQSDDSNEVTHKFLRTANIKPHQSLSVCKPILYTHSYKLINIHLNFIPPILDIVQQY